MAGDIIQKVININAPGGSGGSGGGGGGGGVCINFVNYGEKYYSIDSAHNDWWGVLYDSPIWAESNLNHIILGDGTVVSRKKGKLPRKESAEFVKNLSEELDDDEFPCELEEVLRKAEDYLVRRRGPRPY